MTETADRTAEQTAPVVNAENPWPGLASFAEEHAEFFHGRQREVEDLLRRVRRSPLTVLCGQSGLGKTSLVQAALFPRLRAVARGSSDPTYVPVGIRLDYARGALALRLQIFRSLEPALAAQGIAVPPLAEGETLWEYFHRQDAALADRRGQPVIPVLAFDQFEELFTLGQERGADRGLARDTIDELASLVANRPTEFVEGRFNRDPDLVAGFDFDRQDYRVLLSLREDYLAHLHGLSRKMPAVTQNNMRLTPLDGARALEAVEKPGGRLVTHAAAEAIVRYVAGSRDERRELGQADLPDPDTGEFRSSAGTESIESLAIDPSLLSLFCRELNQKRRETGAPAITPELVAASREDILRNFYSRCLARLPTGAQLFVEENLLTETGYRETLSEDTARSMLRKHGVSDPAVLATLVNRRLLHFEERGGLKRVELTHDVLAPVVRQSRDERKQREKIAAEQRERELALEEEERRVRAAREEAERRDLERTRELERARRRWKVILGVSGAMALVTAVAVYQTVQAGALAATLSERNQALEAQQKALTDTTRIATEARDSAGRLKATAEAARDTARRMAVSALAARATSDSLLAQFCNFTSSIVTQFGDSTSRRRDFSGAFEAVVQASDPIVEKMVARGTAAACPPRLNTQLKTLAAEQYRDRGRNVEARAKAHQGLVAVRQAERLRDSTSTRLTAQAYLDLAYSLFFLGEPSDYDSAVVAVRRGAYVAGRISPASDTMAFERRARLFHYGATSLIRRNRPAEARTMVDSGLRVVQAGLLLPRQGKIGLHYTASQLAMRGGEVDSLEGNPLGHLAGYRRALESARTHSRLSFGVRWLANVHGWLGDAALRAHRPAEALTAYDSSATHWSEYESRARRRRDTSDMEVGVEQLSRIRLSASNATDSLRWADSSLARARSAALVAAQGYSLRQSSSMRSSVHRALQRVGGLLRAGGQLQPADSVYRILVRFDSAFVEAQGGRLTGKADLASVLANRAQVEFDRGQYRDARADDTRRIALRKEILDSALAATRPDTQAVRFARENLATALVSMGWYHLFGGSPDTTITLNAQAARLDPTDTYWIPNQLNALLLLGRTADADAFFRQHAGREVENPRLPFACAVLRDLEQTLIPRGAARAEHLQQAEELTRRHTSLPASECSHRKNRQ